VTASYSLLLINVPRYFTGITATSINFWIS